MTTSTTSPPRPTGISFGRQMLNKVPEVTIYFWVIKIMATTVGETVADYLNTNVGLGLKNTSYVFAALLIVALFFQFRTRRYVPGVYWFVVVVISVMGTLITDNLTDNYNVALTTTTIVFSVCLALTFVGWFASERTLSIHTIVTSKREAWYWLTILFTFALGTAAGDLISEKANLGYFVTLLLFVGAIAAVTFAHFVFRLNAVLAFWIAYILTRPLGASTGDLLTAPTHDGGLGLSTNLVSGIFLAVIIGLVTFLSITKVDIIETPIADEIHHDASPA